MGVRGTFGGVSRRRRWTAHAKEGLRLHAVLFHRAVIADPGGDIDHRGATINRQVSAWISEISDRLPGYDSVITPDNRPSVQSSRQKRLRHVVVGKNHNTQGVPITPSPAVQQGPVEWALTYFYGYVGGEDRQWTLTSLSRTKEIFPWIGKPD